MKTSKKFLRVLISLVMVLSMAMPAAGFQVPTDGNDIYIAESEDGGDISGKEQIEAEDEPGIEELEENSTNESIENDGTEDNSETEELSEEKSDEELEVLEPVILMADMPDAAMVILDGSTTADALQSMINAVEEGESIEFIVEEGFTLDKAIVIKESIAVTFLAGDLKAITIKQISSNERHFIVKEAATLNLGDEDGTGSFILDGSNSGGGIEVLAMGNMMLCCDLTIQNCHNDAYGGGLLVQREGAVSLTEDEDGSQLKISNCTAGINGGGMCLFELQEVKINNSVVIIEYCKAENNGGGLYADGGEAVSSIEFKEIFIQNCTAGNNGGGIYAASISQFDFKGDAIISYCTAETGNGGGIYALDSNMYFDQVDNAIYGNTAHHNKALQGFGGFLYAEINIDDSMHQDITKVEIYDNEAIEGGAVFACGYVMVNLNECNIYNNTAVYDGGAVKVKGQDSQVILYKTELENNKTTGQNSRGGAVYLEEIFYLFANEIIVKDNSADFGGGIYYKIGELNGNTVKIEGYFKGNTAAYNGGAIAIINESVPDNLEYDFSLSLIENKAVKGNGGGIYLENKGKTSGEELLINFTESSLVDEDKGIEYDLSEINGNTAGNYGGAIYSTTADDQITKIEINEYEILNNTAGRDGGAIYLSTEKDELLTAETIFEDNKAGGNGGAIFSAAFSVPIASSDFSNLTIEDTTVFTGNTASEALPQYEVFPHLQGITTSLDGLSGITPGYSLVNNYDINAKASPSEFKVTYNPGDGAGTITDFTVSIEQGHKVLDVTDLGFSYDGYNFTGWNTAEDGSGDSYQPGSLLISGDDVTLYAQWGAEIPASEDYIVDFDANGGTPVPPSQTVAAGDKVSAPSPQPTRADYTLEGWYTDNGTFNNKWNFSTDEVTGNMTLYAKWTADSPGSTGGGGGRDGNLIFVKFNANGGSPTPETQTVRYGGKAKMPEENPIRSGYEFLGWYTTQECVTLYDFADPVYKDTTLYAGWRIKDDGIHYPYVFGYPDGSFKPEANATRAEMAQILFNLSAPYTPNGVGAPFSDVKDSSLWFYQGINYMASKGVVSGYPDGTYKPNGNITRAEFVTLVARYMGLNSTGVSQFPDVSAGHWASGYIAAAQAEGILSGYPDGTFRPDDYISRVETVVIMNRVEDRIPLNGMFNNTSIPFNDITKSYWGFEEVMEAATQHEAH